MRFSHLFNRFITGIYEFSESFLKGEIYRSIINPPELTQDERERFLEYSHDEFIYIIMSWAVSVIAIILLSSPLDFVVYQYSVEMFWIVLGEKVVGVIGLLLLVWVIRTYSFEGMTLDRVCTFIIMVILMVEACVLSQGGGLDSVYFQPLYVFPVVILLGFRFSLKERFFWLCSGILLMAIGFFGPNPHYLQTDSVLFVLTVLIFGSAYYLMGSQMVSNLYISSFKKNLELEEAHNRSEDLLLNILPEQVADQLKREDRRIADDYSGATVLFADIVNFTPIANELPAKEVVSILDEIFSSFDDLIEPYDVEKIKTIGDEYFVVAGVPEPADDHAVTMAKLAFDLKEEVRTFSRQDGTPFRLRIGMNTGPLVAGIIGKKKYVYDVWGDTVNVGSRMESSGVPGEIQVTSSTKEAIRKHAAGGNFTFESRGEVELNGVGKIETFFLRQTSR
jgi:class 3 adenylate cyclase